MQISIVVPVYNEEKYIEKLLNWLVSVKPANKEIFIIDGLSTDNTREIITDFASRYSTITLLINESKYVPYALNLAIPKCTGDIIVRLDAHTDYDDSYFEKIIETFNQHDADIVGGPMRKTWVTPFQKAVALATSTGFGVGDSKFHDSSFKGFTDSVYLGAWKREIFAHAGLFDTRMKRNQDDEFHYRAKSMGYKLFLNPEIISHYYPRKDLKSLCKQYFQYGLYKPLVSKKIKSEIKLRHIIPTVLVFYLLLLPMLLLNNLLWIIPLLIYFLLNLLFSLFITKTGIFVRIIMTIIYPAVHISYGSGYLCGLLRLLPRIKK